MEFYTEYQVNEAMHKEVLKAKDAEIRELKTEIKEMHNKAMFDEARRKEALNNKNIVELQKEFMTLSMPLIKFINDNYDPQTAIIITSSTAELLDGKMGFAMDEYVND